MSYLFSLTAREADGILLFQGLVFHLADIMNGFAVPTLGFFLSQLTVMIFRIFFGQTHFQPDREERVYSSHFPGSFSDLRPRVPPKSLICRLAVGMCHLYIMHRVLYVCV